MSPSSNGDNPDPKRERSRQAQREYRKRHASRFQTLKDENQRLRNALKRIDRFASERGDQDKELQSVLSEAKAIAQIDEDDDTRALATTGSRTPALSDPTGNASLSDLPKLLSSDIHLHAQSLGQDSTPCLSLERLWTNTDRLFRIFDHPSYERKYFGDGLFTFAGTLYWACIRNTVFLWETYKLNMLGKPALPDAGRMSRLFDHSKDICERRFMLSLALMRLEHKHKGFMDLPHPSNSLVRDSVLPKLRRKMRQNLRDHGVNPAWWKTPVEVESYLIKYLVPSEIAELQALMKGQGTEALAAKYSPLMEILIDNV
ncbi:hypothetical protein F66182_6345, partial [Fusarium sp. NRRL 66182]